MGFPLRLSLTEMSGSQDLFGENCGEFWGLACGWGQHTIHRVQAKSSVTTRFSPNYYVYDPPGGRWGPLDTGPTDHPVCGEHNTEPLYRVYAILSDLRTDIRLHQHSY